MELVNYTGTHVTRLFNVRRGDTPGPPPLVGALRPFIERYKFMVYPEGEALFTEKFVFQHGAFNGFAIDAYEMYNDGTVTRGRCSSNLLEDFEQDVEAWFAKEWGAKRLETHDVHRSYESNVIFSASQRIFAAIDTLEAAARAVTRLLKESTGSGATLHPAGFQLAAEPSKIAGLRPVPFRLERKLDVEFDKGLFFSCAPLRTDDHLALLKQLEG